MRELRFLKLWLTLGWALVGFVIFISLIPLPAKPPAFDFGDKLAHLFLYAFVMFWFGLIYLPGRTLRYLAIGFTLMGISLEFIQGATHYRAMQYSDMVANAVGVLLGWFLSMTRLSSGLSYFETRFDQDN